MSELTKEKPLAKRRRNTKNIHKTSTQTAALTISAEAKLSVKYENKTQEKSRKSPRKKSRSKFKCPPQLFVMTEESDIEFAEKYGIPGEQVAQLRTIFGQFDEDNDGHITGDEIGAAMQSLGHKTTDKSISQLVKATDGDGDGKITFEEFIIVLAPKIKAKEKKDALLLAFQQFDKNSDGYISAEELKTAWEAMGESITAQEAKGMIASADEDGDGRVSYKEFVKMWKDL